MRKSALVVFSVFIMLIFCIQFQNFSLKEACAEESGKAGKEKKFIVVYGKQYRLVLYNENGKVLRKYIVGIGLNGMGKACEGDKKTPVGRYRIIWKASRFDKTDGGYPIRDGKAFAGPDNIFTTDPRIGYSSEQLWTAGYGGDRAVVMMLDYPSSSDKARGCTGACIEIHATLLGGLGKKSSAGCVRMHPDDARELYRMVEVGTPVIIKNE